MQRRIRSTLLFSIALPAAAVAGDPPKPDWRQPVDYVAWLNREFAMPGAENAAERYREAVAASVKQSGELRDDLSFHDEGPWSAAQLKLLRDWLQRNERALDLLSKAARMPRCYFPLAAERPGKFSYAQPFLPELRNLLHALMARAALRLRNGQLEPALAELGTVLGIARHLEAQPGFGMRLIADTGYRAPVYRLLLMALDLLPNKFDAERIDRWLREHDKGPPPWAGALLEDKLQMWDMLQRTARDTNGDGEPDEYVYDEDLGIPAVRGETWAAVLEQVERQLQTVRQIAESPNLPTVRALVAKLDNPELVELDLLPELHEPLKMRLWDSWEIGAGEHFEVLATYRGLRAVLCMHLYRLEHGRWPADLKAALERESPDLRRDPFSGGDFVYRFKEDGPLLYSVGWNGKDDGGRWEFFLGKPQYRWNHAEGDYVFWPPPGTRNPAGSSQSQATSAPTTRP